MDGYLEIGNYYCATNAIASTLKNCPFNRAFTLKIEYGTGTRYQRQLFKEYDTGRMAFRSYNSSASVPSWGNYVYFSDDATLFAGTAIQSGDDLNDYTKPGRYYSPSASVTALLSNMPEIFESGFSMDVLPVSANKVQVIYAGGGGGIIYTRSSIASGWMSWYKFTGTIIFS